jgi:predicted permease
MSTQTTQDLAFAVRMLWKKRVFTVVSLLSVAIGIGATTAVFSLANALLFRPVEGITSTRGLVDVGRTQSGEGFDTVSYPNYVDLKARTRSFEQLYAYEIEPAVMSLGTAQGGEPVRGTVVSGNFFEALGLRAPLGRVFADRDDGKSAAPVVVLSYQLWKERYGADHNLVGQTLRFNSFPFTVVGIAPEGFHGTSALRTDVWFPISSIAQAMPRMSASSLESRHSVWLMMGGRLKEGVSREQANAELATVSAQLEREYPEANKGKSYRVAPMSRVPGQANVVAGFMAILLFIVSLVLLIACTNVAGMLIARAAERQHEIAVRLAIGANQRRIMRQLLTETFVLFAIAGIAGVLLSRWIVSAIVGLLPRLPVALSVVVALDWRVLLFACALVFGAAMLAGFIPALQASRQDLLSFLRLTPLNSSGSRNRVRDVFVVAQVALSVLLLVTAALFTRAVQHASKIDPGFEVRNVDVVSLDLALAGYKKENGPAVIRELIDRLSGIAGVESVAATVDLPLDGGRMSFGPVTIPGADAAGNVAIQADENAVTPGYFSTMRLPLTAGREFAEADGPNSMRVAIVNKEFAKRSWPGLDPIGRRFLLGGDEKERGTEITVVGVASDAHMDSLNEPAGPYRYLPIAQEYNSRISFVLRTRSGSLMQQERTAITDVNPNLAVTSSLLMSDVTAIQQVPQVVAGALAGGLGTVGLLLVGIGIYGIVAQSVVRRTREIGVRVALGADRKSIVQLLLHKTALLVGAGTVIGIAGGAALGRVLNSLLAGVGAFDAIGFATPILLLLVVSLLALYVPVRRALALDIVAALRDE